MVQSRHRIAGIGFAILLIGFWLAACVTPSAPPPETPLPLAWRAKLTLNITRPVAADGLIIVASEPNKIVALDAETGTQRWTAELGQASFSDDPLGVDGGRVFAVTQGDDGKVVAFDALTGSRLWELPIGPNRSDEHPLAQAGRVYFEASDVKTNSASLRAVDAATGATVWDFPIGSFVVTAPIVGNGLIYVGAYTFDGSNNKSRWVYAIDTATGNERWRYRSDLDLGDRFALDDTHIYIPMEAGVLVARQAATGEPGWTARVGGSRTGPPTSIGETVYVGTTDGEMLAVQAGDGAERWRMDAGSAILTQAVEAEGILYFGTNDGFLYAVDAQSGKESWKVQSPLQRPLAQPQYIPAMYITPVVVGDQILYFNTDSLVALTLP